MAELIEVEGAIPSEGEAKEAFIKQENLTTAQILKSVEK